MHLLQNNFLRLMSEGELRKEFEKFLATAPFGGMETMRTAEAYELMLEITANSHPRPDGSRIGHVLRVTLMGIHLGATSANEVVALLLHDAPEDQAKELNEKLGFMGQTYAAKRENAYEYIRKKFGEKVKTLVEGLSTPVNDVGAGLKERHEAYVTHSKEVLTNPEFAKLKLAAMYDNGVNVHLIMDNKKRFNMCQRYQPVYPTLLASVESGIISLNDQIKNGVLNDIKGIMNFVNQELQVTA